jgi:hypothetical protein
MSNAELAVSYAALILADDGVDITVRNIRSRTCAGLLNVWDTDCVTRPTSSSP